MRVFDRRRLSVHSAAWETTTSTGITQSRNRPPANDVDSYEVVDNLDDVQQCRDCAIGAVLETTGRPHIELAGELSRLCIDTHAGRVQDNPMDREVKR